MKCYNGVLRFCILLCFASLLPQVAFADLQKVGAGIDKVKGKVKDTFVDVVPKKFDFSIGLSINRHIIEVRNAKTEELASYFVSSIYPTPTFSLTREVAYFGDTRFGWFVESNIGTYSVDRQEDETGFVKDMGTQLQGWFGHVNPMIFYRWGDKYHAGAEHWSFGMGVGYGISVLNVSGEFLTTREDTVRRVSVDARGWFFLPAVYGKLRYENWYTSIIACFGGPGFEVDEFTYRLIFRSVAFGYSLAF